MLLQAAYFLAWPTLGSAILLLGDPGYEGQKQTLQRAGLLDSEAEREIQDSKTLQMQKLREAAQGRSW